MAKYHGNHNDNHMLVIEGRQSSPLGVQSTLGGEFNARENTHRRKASETTQVRVCEPQSNLSPLSKPQICDRIIGKGLQVRRSSI